MKNLLLKRPAAVNSAARRGNLNLGAGIRISGLNIGPAASVTRGADQYYMVHYITEFAFFQYCKPIIAENRSKKGRVSRINAFSLFIAVAGRLNNKEIIASFKQTAVR